MQDIDPISERDFRETPTFRHRGIPIHRWIIGIMGISVIATFVCVGLSTKLLTADDPTVYCAFVAGGTVCGGVSAWLLGTWLVSRHIDSSPPGGER